jgi:hypothetical protein
MKDRPKGDRPRADRRGPPTGARSGPRARAAQERTFSNDPYQRAERPRMPPRERLQAGGGGIRLDPDVARVFRDAESVNEALRLVIRLARFGGGRPSAPRPRPAFGEDGPPRAFAKPRPRPAGRDAAPRRPRFKDPDAS